MNADKLPGGLWPVMLTPFLENNQIDHSSLATLTDFYISSGATGLFSNCLSSEMFQLSDHERLEVIRTVVSVARSRVPVVASGTFSADLHRCYEFISKVYDTGVDAVIIITNKLVEIEEGEDVLKKNIERLLTLTGDIPLGLYECPDPYKRLLTPELMEWLAQTGQFFYHKDTSCDPAAIKRKLEVTKGSALSFFNANTTTALYSLELGAAGISPIGANLYPELYSWLIREFYQNGSSRSLQQLNEQLDMMDAVLDQCYPYSAKVFLQWRGLPITTHCRIPYGKFKSENLLKLKALLEVFRETSARFGVGIGDLQKS